METAEELCREIREQQLPHRGSEVSDVDVVTISVGAACMAPSSGLNARALVEAADKELYVAKSSGRNQAAGVALIYCEG